MKKLIQSIKNALLFIRISLNVIWRERVSVPVLVWILILALAVYDSVFKYSKKEYDRVALSGYNVGCQAGIKDALKLQNT